MELKAQSWTETEVNMSESSTRFVHVQKKTCHQMFLCPSDMKNNGPQIVLAMLSIHFTSELHAPRFILGVFLSFLTLSVCRVPSRADACLTEDLFLRKPSAARVLWSCKRAVMLWNACLCAGGWWGSDRDLSAPPSPKPPPHHPWPLCLDAGALPGEQCWTGRNLWKILPCHCRRCRNTGCAGTGTLQLNCIITYRSQSEILSLSQQPQQINKVIKQFQRWGWGVEVNTIQMVLKISKQN